MKYRRRFAELERLLVEYDEGYLVTNPGTPRLGDGGFSIGIGYPERNLVVSTAWDTVDWLDRLRKLLGVVAGIKKKELWCQLAVRALADTEDIRNFVQHFDANLQTLVEGNYPLTGTVFASFPCASGYYVRALSASAEHRRVFG